MVPEKLSEELRRDHAGEPLEGTIVSVQPAGSPARSLHAHLSDRLDRIGKTAEAVERPRWPIGLRLIFTFTVAILSWAMIFLAGWAIASFIG